MYTVSGSRLSSSSKVSNGRPPHSHAHIHPGLQRARASCEKLGNELRPVKRLSCRRFDDFEEVPGAAARSFVFVFLFFYVGHVASPAEKMPVEMLNTNPMPP